VHVEFDRVGAELLGTTERRQCILRAFAGGAAMSDDFRVRQEGSGEGSGGCGREGRKAALSS